MALISEINIRDRSIGQAKLVTEDKYTVSGVTACMIAIGSNAGANSDPPLGCFYLSTSNSSSAYFDSTSAGGRSTIIVKSLGSEFHIYSQDDVLTISPSGADGGVCIPTLSGCLIGGTPWTTTGAGGACIFYNDGYVGLGLDDPLQQLSVSGNICTCGSVSGGVNIEAAVDVCAVSDVCAGGNIIAATDLCAATNAVIGGITCSVGNICSVATVCAGAGVNTNCLCTNWVVACCTGSIAGCPGGKFYSYACDDGGTAFDTSVFYGCIVSGADTLECTAFMITTRCGGSQVNTILGRYNCVAITPKLCAVSDIDSGGSVSAVNCLIGRVCTTSTTPSTITCLSGLGAPSATSDAAPKCYVDAQGAAGQSQEFTSSCSWTVPTGVSIVFVTAQGAGGGGSGAATNVPAGGGGSGMFVRRYPLPVTGGGTLCIIVGAGGSGGCCCNTGTDGGVTCIGCLIVAAGTTPYRCYISGEGGGACYSAARNMGGYSTSTSGYHAHFPGGCGGNCGEREGVAARSVTANPDNSCYYLPGIQSNWGGPGSAGRSGPLLFEGGRRGGSGAFKCGSVFCRGWAGEDTAFWCGGIGHCAQGDSAGGAGGAASWLCHGGDGGCACDGGSGAAANGCTACGYGAGGGGGGAACSGANAGGGGAGGGAYVLIDWVA